MKKKPILILACLVFVVVMSCFFFCCSSNVFFFLKRFIFLLFKNCLKKWYTGKKDENRCTRNNTIHSQNKKKRKVILAARCLYVYIKYTSILEKILLLPNLDCAAWVLVWFRIYICCVHARFCPYSYEYFFNELSFRWLPAKRCSLIWNNIKWHIFTSNVQ